jgi:F-type H+-transporting ATPase subunit a
MPITPDYVIYWQWHFIHLNATILYSWILMLLLTGGSWLITRRISDAVLERSRWQSALEVVVQIIRKQISEVCPDRGDSYLPFVGTIFIFIAASSLLDIVPGWRAPTGSLSSTAALAICVAVSVHIFGIWRQGFAEYLRHYLRPIFVMLPFHLLNEVSRTLALAVRLFGNIMSEGMIVGVLLAIAPLVFPVVMQVFGLLTGLIQAYIFAVLAIVYIAAGTQAQQEGDQHE